MAREINNGVAQELRLVTDHFVDFFAVLVKLESRHGLDAQLLGERLQIRVRRVEFREDDIRVLIDELVDLRGDLSTLAAPARHEINDDWLGSSDQGVEVCARRDGRELGGEIAVRRTAA